ncbi:hypothetical protein [Rhodopirellula europaea]|uniref:hypothetical protein n=1 Tax=Rhodopirellula europaea TaxID=1263866 RepID=UPI003D2770E6
MLADSIREKRLSLPFLAMRFGEMDAHLRASPGQLPAICFAETIAPSGTIYAARATHDLRKISAPIRKTASPKQTSAPGYLCRFAARLHKIFAAGDLSTP